MNNDNNNIDDGLVDAAAWAIVYARIGLQACPLVGDDRRAAGEIITNSIGLLLAELDLPYKVVTARAAELAPELYKGPPKGATLH